MIASYQSEHLFEASMCLWFMQQLCCSCSRRTLWRADEPSELQQITELHNFLMKPQSSIPPEPTAISVCGGAFWELGSLH